MCCTDIAVIVFNNCTSENSGETIPVLGGTEVVAQDSHNFKVTFDYEFLEDFREQRNQGIQERNPIGIRHTEDGFHEPKESDREEIADEIDAGFLPLAAATKRLAVYVSSGEKTKNNWGPEGFNKGNHPLNIMVY